MAAIQPTSVFELIIDEFIRNATSHLTTVSGVIGTLSIYPPIPTPAQGIVNWKGYTVPPTPYTKDDILNRVIINDIIKNPPTKQVQLETDPNVNAEANATKGETSGYRVNDNAWGFDPDEEDLVVVNILETPIEPATVLYKTMGDLIVIGNEVREDLGGINEFEFDEDGGSGGGQPGDSGYDGSTTLSLGKLTVIPGGRTTNSLLYAKEVGLTRAEYLKKYILNSAGGLELAKVDLSQDWVEIAVDYMITREGFKPGPPRMDVDKKRLGYGTDYIWDVGASEPRLVKDNDITTEPQALKTLYWQVRTTFKKAVVGTGSLKITEDDWNALTETQRAALVIHVYNCGSFGNTTGVPIAIKAKDYVAAGNAILNGPLRGGDNVYGGLIKRRAEEAVMFMYGL